MVRTTSRWSRFVLCSFWLLLACGSSAPKSPSSPRYTAHFDAKLEPAAEQAEVTIRIEQSRLLLSELTLRMPKARYSMVGADGATERKGQYVTWQLPAQGGSFRYRYRVTSKRESGAFDARLTKAGGLFRGDDLFPPATVLTNERARSISYVRVHGPQDWSVETRFGNTSDKQVRVFDAQRRFDRPTGWMLAGPLGIRRDEIAGTKVSVAAIRGERLRRNDILAFLRWNLPVLKQALGDFPRRLLILGADDPYWRGGLSGPQSLYVHSERPLIGEDGTSTLLHELVHVATRLRAARGDDWIVEGIAEFYSLEILRRSGTVSANRAATARENLAQRANGVESLHSTRAAGDLTAQAVTLFYALDDELKAHTPNGLDAVAQKLAAQRDVPVNFDGLKQAVKELGLTSSPTLARMEALLP